MKKKIHPKYGECVVRCACGNVIETRGTKEDIHVDICSSCHPFFTGRQKLVDSAGRIDKFKKKYNLEGKLVGCCVDRMDYTKGIPERLEAIEILFDKHPGWRGKFTFMQVCSPSRGEITEYRAVKRQVQLLTKRINEKYATDDWKPVVVFHRNVPFDDILAMYRMSDVAIVSPLIDGMNLVAKEFIAAQVEEKGVLVLSQFAGAVRSISHALKFNPFDVG